eukprot:UN25180
MQHPDWMQIYCLLVRTKKCETYSTCFHRLEMKTRKSEHINDFLLRRTRNGLCFRRAALIYVKEKNRWALILILGSTMTRLNHAQDLALFGRLANLPHSRRAVLGRGGALVINAARLIQKTPSVVKILL